MEFRESETVEFKKSTAELKEAVISLVAIQDIEKWGSGLKRIHDACGENEVQPEFQTLKTGFQVVFYRHEDQVQTIQKDVQKLSRHYPETIQKILSAISKNPHITITQLSKTTGLSEIGVKYDLRKLKKDGVLKRVGPDKGGYWEVVKR